MLNKYPYTLLNLVRDNPQVSFPKNISKELLATYGLYEVEYIEPPEFNSQVQTLRESFPLNDGISWKRVWTIENLPLETASSNVRSYRSRLLSESDWTQTEDSPVDKNSWKTYRQALRDISTQEGFPYNIIWPTPPS